MILSGVGRLGRDVECRFLQDGTAVANLALAFNYGRKDQSGRTPSQWIDVALFGKQAEAMSPYLKKGGQVDVVVSGIHIENYTKNDGTQQSKLVGRIINIDFVGGNNAQATQQRTEQPTPQQQPTQPSQSKPKDNFDADYDDDIPF